MADEKKVAAGEEVKAASKAAAPKAKAEAKPAAKKAAAEKKAAPKTEEKKPAAEKKAAPKAEAKKQADKKASGKTLVVTSKNNVAAKNAAAPAKGQVKVTLRRALAGRTKTQIAVANSLGLKVAGDVSFQPDNAATRGKINKIAFLLSVAEA